MGFSPLSPGERSQVAKSISRSVRNAHSFELRRVVGAEDLPEDHGTEDHDVKDDGDDATADRDNQSEWSEGEAGQQAENENNACNCEHTGSGRHEVLESGCLRLIANVVV